MQKEQSIALHHLNGIMTNIPFGIITIAKDLDVSMLNGNALSLLGFTTKSPSDFIDIHYENILHHVPELQEKFESEILEQKNRKFNISNFIFKDKILNIKFRSMLHGTLIIIEDYTIQANLQSELQHQANHDSLTNLLNRKELEKRVRAFAKNNAEQGLVGAIVFIDLDRFKPVNDIGGHAAGDELLKKVAEFMKDAIRERDTLARVGGDEFIILLENCPLSRAITITEKIRKSIDEFIFNWEEHTFSIGISAGVSVMTNEMEDVCEALDIADQACLIAKNEGRNRTHVADDSLRESAEHKKEISWINVINDALKNDKFVLFAQEIQEITSNPKTSHYELLLRLKNDEGKYLSPAAFMPSAERYELMTKIDEWVVENAFKRVQSDINYSINLSGQTMSSPDFSDYILQMEKRYKINPKQITFEITESMAIKYYENTKILIQNLMSRGYAFSLDDFGTGLSSYAYLKKMPVTFLKIDGVFVKEIVEDKVSYAMVKSINEIGHVMGLKTIAEFVENQEILDKLFEIGVDYAQGYHVHKPEEL